MTTIKSYLKSGFVVATIVWSIVYLWPVFQSAPIQFLRVAAILIIAIMVGISPLLFVWFEWWYEDRKEQIRRRNLVP